MKRQQEHQQRQVVQVIRKSARLEIHAAVSTFRGKRFADLRTFVATQAGLVATPKGITVPLQQLTELEMAVRKLREAVEGAPTLA